MAKLIKDINKSKEEFLKALSKSLGIILTATQNCKVSRTTYYRWMREDDEFAKAVEQIKEERKDFVESKLIKLIEDNNITAIIFFAKTQMKDRGYQENVDITSGGQRIVGFTIGEPDAEGTINKD